jgi:hypothetical protein
MSESLQPANQPHDEHQKLEDDYLRWVQGESVADPIDPQRPGEEAAVRQPAPEVTAATLTAQQMAVTAAARAIRKDAGLPPKPYDLR